MRALGGHLVLHAPTAMVKRLAYRRSAGEPGSRALIEETPVALTASGSTLAVMMATPSDLEDFALGFCLSEGVARRASEVEEMEVLAFDEGIELRLSLTPEAERRFHARRRNLMGPTGCGLCGVESLAAAVAPSPEVTTPGRISAASIRAALGALDAAQRLHAATRAAHGAALWDCRERRLLALREDVGRHNALDKLAGAVARRGLPLDGTAVLMTSRVSVELVQKAAWLGAPILIALSAPTTLAVRAAERAGLTLIGVARSDGFEAFTRPDRLETEP